MPSFGQISAEVTLLVWLKQEGDRVERGEAIADAESDKALVQIEAFTSGYLRRILQPPGSVVAAGEPIALLTPSRDEPLAEAVISRAAPARDPLMPKPKETPRAVPQSAASPAQVVAPARDA